MADSTNVDRVVGMRQMSQTNLRKLWARSTIVKRILIGRGFITKEQWEEEEGAMVRDIENKIRAEVRKEMGLEDE